MGRAIKRVPLDFDAPKDRTWEGYVMPDSLSGITCESCAGRGDSPEAKHLSDLWYGYVPFKPEDNGSEPLTIDTPAVRAFAERNVSNAPEFYGEGEWAIQREAQRLADIWNDQWSHHLNEQDIADIIADADARWDLTHEWVSGEGHGSHEAYPGQRTEADAWERIEPPEGEGWQMWQTVSDAPLSPVFPTAEGLIEWMTTPAAKWGASGPWSRENAEAFVRGAGWAPTLVGTSHGMLVDGVTATT